MNNIKQALVAPIQILHRASRTIALPAAFALSLVACGGDSSDQTSMPTTNSSPNNGASTLAIATTAVGSVTGFGSIIVDGVKYDDSKAKVFVDQKGVDVSSTVDSLKIGMQVEVKADGSSVTAPTSRWNFFSVLN